MTYFTPDNLKLAWCDFHKHVRSAEDAQRSFEAVRGFLGCYPALLYPYENYSRHGRLLESQLPTEEHKKRWKEIKEVVARYDEPGKFVAMAGYEWHGDRRRFGDLNVFYFGQAPALVFPRSLEALYTHLRKYDGIAIPHHTAYAAGHAGTDWGATDPELSPVLDIFSVHGSSEAEGRGDLLPANAYMGPGVSGSTAQDAFHRGLHVGVIASNDGDGLPGSWGMGLAALWCEELTREGIRRALAQRRTYGVTGDRIRLWFSANEHPMGSIFSASGPVTFDINVVGGGAIDRIELIRNGRTLQTYCHNGSWEDRPLPERVKVKSRFRFGWGPLTELGYRAEDSSWKGEIKIMNGKLLDVEPCFSRFGQGIDRIDGEGCRWHMTTSTVRGEFEPPAQGLIFEIDGGKEARLILDVEGKHLELKMDELMRRSQVWDLRQEALERIHDQFGLDEADIPPIGNIWAASRKIKADLAVPESAYHVQHQFRDTPLPGRESYYYVRVTQNNGQMAWSSPVWVRA